MPIPVEPSAPRGAAPRGAGGPRCRSPGSVARPPIRDIAAITYAANPDKKGLDHVLAAWKAHREGEELVVAGADLRSTRPACARSGTSTARRTARCCAARASSSARPRREEYGIAQLEALADGCMLVTTAGARPVRRAPARPRAGAGARRRAPRRRSEPRCASPSTSRRPATPSARPSARAVSPRGGRRRRARRAAAAAAGLRSRFECHGAQQRRPTPNAIRARATGRPATRTSTGTHPARLNLKPPGNPVSGPTGPS